MTSTDTNPTPDPTRDADAERAMAAYRRDVAYILCDADDVGTMVNAIAALPHPDTARLRAAEARVERYREQVQEAYSVECEGEAPAPEWAEKIIRWCEIGDMGEGSDR